ncbi:cupin domain-containing protein [Shewanella corallii]|uniref:Cupin domain-containing protein n=1 Tax=Shewanella corallii TaxID=560080 RepID=A0ABT0N8R5_9GAMM|nr:cupin domain-containing protein [Shewanella corallii]MCL2914212.1 cupin domain-containing protein [Shewanella corallii]
MHKVSPAVAEHYHWGEGADGWHLVKTDSLSVIQERMPANSHEQMHCHQYATQFFYILKGEAVMRFLQESVLLKAGEGILIEPERYHQMCNESTGELHFTVTSTPPSHGDRALLSSTKGLTQG